MMAHSYFPHTLNHLFIAVLLIIRIPFNLASVVPLNAGVEVLLLAPHIEANSFSDVHVEGRISKGDTTQGYPFMACLVGFSPTQRYITGAGTIVSRRYILSSASFAFGKLFIEVYVGSNEYKKGTLYNVTNEENNIKIHKYFNRVTLANDLSLIRTQRTIIDEPGVQIARLSQNYGNLEGLDVIIAGWGSLSYNDVEDYSKVLHSANQNVLPSSICDYEHVTNKHICVSTFYGKIPCKGDIGGPLIRRTDRYGLMVLGVASKGHEEGCSKVFPYLYTRVSSYFRWLSENSDFQI